MSFVEQVPFQYTGVYAPIEDVKETIDYTRAYATDQADSLSDAIENLEALTGSYVPDFSVINSVIPSLVSPSFPPKPDLNTNLNENWPTDDVPDPNILENSPDFSFIDPVAPSPLDPSFDYTPGIFSSCLWVDLCSQVRDDLINGGTGLNDSVYGLILNRDSEARRSIEEESRQRLYDAVGESGFGLPGGMASEAILQHEREIHAKNIDAINSTTIKDFDLADGNTKFIKELSLKMEGIQRAAYDNDENRLFEIAKVSKDFIIAIYDQNVKIYIAQWEGVKIKLESLKVQVEAIISRNEGEIKVFLGKIEAFKARVEAIAAENKSKTDVTIAKADIYKTEVSAISSQFSALVEEIRVAMDKYRLELSESIEKEKINLSAYTSGAALSERIAESIANIAAQSVASALGALNTSESIAYSGSESLGYSSSLTNSLSEGHSYEES